MSIAVRAARIPAVAIVLWALFAAVVPTAMTQYAAYEMGRGPGTGCRAGLVRSCGQALTVLYEQSLPGLIAEAALRSLVLLVGAAAIALTLGVFIGALAAIVRRRALASGAVLAATGLTAAIPSFFVAYFLQIAVIVFGSSATGSRFLPVYGFGYDEHIVLPLLAVAIPAVAITAQLTATRVSDVMEAEFVTTANAKGLFQSWIVRVHVLPHALPVVLEGLGSGLRVSIASLPIVEYIFNWNGIGYVALQSIANRDAAALTASALVLVTLFALLSFVADIGRPRFAYR
ncbi:MAG TPA: ABC transporter permease [Candidatus Limnocylindria bacterium]|jgi:peptide/nickel transport system permease protein|nr:ABC transporter permease [Candidatus Limnocylindria bacterium]